jgi:hypothetical protein
MKQLKPYTTTVERLYKGGNVMNVFHELVNRVDSGETFRVDFEKRNPKVGRQFLIKNGECCEGMQIDFGWGEEKFCPSLKSCMIATNTLFRAKEVIRKERSISRRFQSTS